MLSQNPFYWGSIRKVIESFAALFSDIHIVRVDKNNMSNTQTLKVPLQYGPKEKWYYRTKQDPLPGVDDQVMIVLPIMSWEIVTFQYDNPRKLPSTGQTVKALMSGNTVLQAQFNPVPYNIVFNLNVRVKNITDGLMIIEQILPFFTPEYTIALNDVPLGFEKDIPVVLNSVQCEDTWDGPNFTDLRFITWVLTFTAKMYLYPPELMQKVILQNEINFNVEGANGIPSNLPQFTQVPYPPGATALTITGATTIESIQIVVMVIPSTATLSSGHNVILNVYILNTSDQGFTITGVGSVDTTVVAGNRVTYYAGSRSQTEIVTIVFISTADPLQNTSVVLTLNP